MVVADLMAKMGLDLSAFDRNLDHAHNSASRFARKDIEPNLGLDDSEFDRKLAQDKKKMSSLGDGMKGKLGSVLSTGALAGVAAIGTGMAAGIYTGIKYNSTLEQTTISLGVMLKSTEKAKAVIADVEKMAAATPFQFADLADATKRLIAFGFSADEAVPLMTKLGDIASATGQPIGELATIYGKMKIAGRMTMEDINQLMERQIPIVGLLAKQMGVAEGDVRKLVETGKVGFPQVEQAISDMTGKGGMFEGMMKAQAKSFAGLGSTLADTITMALGDAMKPAFEWLKRTMDEQLNSKDSPLLKFMDVVKNTMPGIAKSAGEIATALGPIASLVEKVAALQNTAPWLQDVFNWLIVIQEPLMAWHKIMKLIKDLSKFIGDTLAKIAEFVFPQPPSWMEAPLSALGLITPQPATGAAAGAPATQPSGNLLGSIIGRLPGMASGGYVPPRLGGTQVTLGEGGEGEHVIPDSKMGRRVAAIKLSGSAVSALRSSLAALVGAVPKNTAAIGLNTRSMGTLRSAMRAVVTAVSATASPSGDATSAAASNQAMIKSAQQGLRNKLFKAPSNAGQGYFQPGQTGKEVARARDAFDKALDEQAKPHKQNIPAPVHVHNHFIHNHFNGPVVGGKAGLRELSGIVQRDVMSGVRRGLVGQNA